MLLFPDEQPIEEPVRGTFENPYKFILDKMKVFEESCVNADDLIGTQEKPPQISTKNP